MPPFRTMAGRVRSRHPSLIHSPVSSAPGPTRTRASWIWPRRAPARRRPVAPHRGASDRDNRLPLLVDSLAWWILPSSGQSYVRPFGQGRCPYCSVKAGNFRSLHKGDGYFPGHAVAVFPAANSRVPRCASCGDAPHVVIIGVSCHSFGGTATARVIAVQYSILLAIDLSILNQAVIVCSLIYCRERPTSSNCLSDSST
jgi:hypothetical protein